MHVLLAGTPRFRRAGESRVSSLVLACGGVVSPARFVGLALLTIRWGIFCFFRQIGPNIVLLACCVFVCVSVCMQCGRVVGRVAAGHSRSCRVLLVRSILY